MGRRGRRPRPHYRRSSGGRCGGPWTAHGGGTGPTGPRTPPAVDRTGGCGAPGQAADQATCPRPCPSGPDEHQDSRLPARPSPPPQTGPAAGCDCTQQTVNRPSMFVRPCHTVCGLEWHLHREAQLPWPQGCPDRPEGPAHPYSPLGPFPRPHPQGTHGEGAGAWTAQRCVALVSSCSCLAGPAGSLLRLPIGDALPKLCLLPREQAACRGRGQRQRANYLRDAGGSWSPMTASSVASVLQAPRQSSCVQHVLTGDLAHLEG